MRINNFDLYQELLKSKSGLVITPDKSYLLESRLGPIAKKWGYATLDAMTDALRGLPDKAIVEDIVDAMTTNETSFFRDQRPFDVFKDFVLPNLVQKRQAQKKLRFWCAAASSGQEPYSICMILKDHETSILNGWRTEFIATDISHEILTQAKDGLYSQFEVQRGLPIKMLMQYFKQEDEKWRISDAIKAMVKYEYFNLLDEMTGLGNFDIIFCRNVLIYFDTETKANILERMAKQLAPDGYLFLGGAETVVGITNAFKPVPDQRGLYAPTGNV